MDLLKIINSGSRYNLHSHTQFCDGHAEMEEFVVEAVGRGFTDYGFSPHSPIPFASSCNMALDDVPRYLAEVDRLRGKYGDRIRLYASMEIDYISSEWNASTDYFATLPLDYRISSVHFVPSDDGYVDIDGRFENFRKKMAVYFHNDIRHVVRLFYQQSMAMVEAGGFDIIGHFDKIGHNASLFSEGIEDEPFYRSLVDDLVSLIIERGLIVEINTKALSRSGRLFPARRYWERLARAGVAVAVNSDAHEPSLIDSGRDVTLAEYKVLLQNVEYNTFTDNIK